MKQFSNLQSDWLDRFEELSDAEAAQINGGSSALVDLANSLYLRIAAQKINFQENIAGSKPAKGNSIKI